jgi:hypothetical protein
MESIASLFNVNSLEKRKSKAGSERASLVEFFVDRLWQPYRIFKKIPDTPKEKKKFVGYLAYKVSHIKLQDLYFMKSTGIEYEKKGGEFSKFFWGTIKVK